MSYWKPISGVKNEDSPSKSRGKNPFLTEEEEAGSGEDREVKSAKKEDETNELEGLTSTSNGLESLTSNGLESLTSNGLEGLTSTACFACDVATQTPLPAKPCCSIM